MCESVSFSFVCGWVYIVSVSVCVLYVCESANEWVCVWECECMCDWECVCEWVCVSIWEWVCFCMPLWVPLCLSVRMSISVHRVSPWQLHCWVYMHDLLSSFSRLKRNRHLSSGVDVSNIRNLFQRLPLLENNWQNVCFCNSIATLETISSFRNNEVLVTKYSSPPFLVLMEK